MGISISKFLRSPNSLVRPPPRIPSRTRASPCLRAAGGYEGVRGARGKVSEEVEGRVAAAGIIEDLPVGMLGVEECAG
jgi:hypothetical protein